MIYLKRLSLVGQRISEGGMAGDRIQVKKFNLARYQMFISNISE